MQQESLIWFVEVDREFPKVSVKEKTGLKVTGQRGKSTERKSSQGHSLEYKHCKNARWPGCRQPEGDSKDDVYLS